MMVVHINQLYRDKYPGSEKRTIRITKFLPNGVSAVFETDTKGERPPAPKTTTLTLKTLRAGYTLIEC